LKTSLENALEEESSLSNAVILDAVNIRKISLPDNFVNAIENKLAAEQLAIAAEFNKTRLLVIADARAQSAIKEAQGLAQSRLIIANATKESIMVIAQSDPNVNISELTKLYLYLETMRDIADTGKSQFIIVPSDSPYILNIP
jgi:regulator of protease activity HflC (stomatin/prohibitin superfamily)